MFKPKSPKGQVLIPSPSIRYPVKLDNYQRTVRLWITLSLTLTVGVAPAGAVKNHGLPSDVFQLAISENGEDTYGIAPAWMLRHLSQYRAASPLPKTSLFDLGVSTTALPIGAHNISETFSIDFADPRTLDPLETAFMETDPTAYLQVEALMNPNAAVSLVAPGGGGATLAISNAQMTVWQDFASGEVGQLPLFKPRVRSFSQTIAGTNADDPFYVKSQAKRIRTIVLGATATDADGGTQIVSDAIVAVRLIGDGKNGNIIGPNKANFIQLVNSQRALAGGDVAALNALYAQYFPEYGRLASTIDPRDFPNLRFEMQDNVSAVGSTVAQAIIEELTVPAQDPNYRVTSTALPAWAE